MVACYQSNNALEFTFPIALLTIVDQKTTYGIKRHDDRSWQLTPGGGRCHLRRVSLSHWTLTFGKGKTNSGVNEFFFGRTKAEYIVVDGNILVSLIENPQPINYHKLQRQVSKVTSKLTIPKPVVQKTDDDLSNTFMRTLLVGIKKVELKTEWRLLKIDGIWRFRIPDIVVDE
jgi:hypothetical protein